MVAGFFKKIIPKSIKAKIKNQIKADTYTAKKEYVLQVSEIRRLQSKVALVTGGSGAIGRAICIRLAAEGALVYVGGRTKENVLCVVNEIRELGLQAEPLVLDVSDDKSIEEAFRVFNNKDGVSKLDILVNCAGGSTRDKASLLHEQSIEVIDQILDTNLRGSMLCSRLACRIMAENRTGNIINISSVIGIQGKSRHTDYAAAKAGIIGYTKSLAIEMGEYGVNVNCVTPGFIQRGEYSSSTSDWLKGTNYLHRIGTLEDIANTVAFMASYEASFITGQNIIVDGGRTLGLHGD